ncbi:MAG: pentapeptide repeat-containing protein [Cyanobacteria bacterium P01_G01_bin.54]
MANPEHLVILERGVEAWNEWRSMYRVIPDLSGANLSETNLSRADLSNANLKGTDLSGADLTGTYLSGADLKGTDLSGANLIGTYLTGAKLSRANLNGANLSGAKLITTDLREAKLREANLSGANLTQIQALSSDFQSANLTDACILDWNINNATNFTDVCCDSIYFGWDGRSRGFDDRRPHDPNQTFEPGDFARLIEQSQETVDLIFSQGIDWNAFLTSFQNLQVSGNHGELTIQGINKKSDGSFVISVETPLGIDKAAVERDFWDRYQPILESKDRQIASLMEIVETMVEKQAEIVKVMAENQGNHNGDIINMNASSHDQSKQVNIAKVKGSTVNVSNKAATEFGHPTHHETEP